MKKAASKCDKHFEAASFCVRSKKPEDTLRNVLSGELSGLHLVHIGHELQAVAALLNPRAVDRIPFLVYTEVKSIYFDVR